MLFALAAAATVTTPLWPAYQDRLGYGPGTTTVLFSGYVLALLPAAAVSPLVWRRTGTRLLALAGVAGVAGGCLMLWLGTSVPVLAAGRLLQGLAVGMASGPLTAVLLTLAAPDRRQAAARATTALLTAGAGAGPVLSGILADVGNQPWAPVFGATLMFLALSTVAAAGVAEPPRPVTAAGAPAAVLPAGALVSLLAWAVAYMVLAVSPAFAAEVLANDRPLVIGAPAGLLLLVSALTQLTAARVSARVSMRAGSLLLIPGLLAFAGVVRVPSLELLMAALAGLGIGHGLAFSGALRTLADQRSGSESTGRFFAVTYAGGTAPVLALGLLASIAGTVAAMTVFALVAAAAALATAASLRHHPAAGRPGS